MPRSPIIHGVLLVAMLGVAYQTWTREKKVETKTGNVVVWNEDSDKLTALVFETKNRTLRIERRGTGAQSHLWGKEIRTRKIRKPRPKPVVTDKDAGPSKPLAPEFEEKITTREFPIGDAGIKLANDFSRLRALRDLGAVSDENRKAYKLDDSIDNVTVSFAGGKTHSLVMGGRVHGTGNRYFIDPESSKGYVLAGPLVSPLSAGETTLTLKKLHAYPPTDEKKATVKVGGKERKLVKIETEVGKGKVKRKRTTWADAATPTKPDQTLANVLEHIGKLKPAQYMVDKKTDGMELIAEVEYHDEGGKNIGYVKLYREAPEAEKTVPTVPAVPGTPQPAPAGKTNPAKPRGKAPIHKTTPVKPAPSKAKLAPSKAKPAAKPEKEVSEGAEEAEQAAPRVAPSKTAKPRARPGAGKPTTQVKARDPRKAAAQARMRKQMQDKIKAMQAKGAKGPHAKGPHAKGPHAKGPLARRPARKPKPRKPQAKYYIMTERTQVLGLLRRPAAERVAQDLKQIFGGQ